MTTRLPVGPAYRVADVYVDARPAGGATFVVCFAAPEASEARRAATLRDTLDDGAGAWALVGPADLVAELERRRAGAVVPWVRFVDPPAHPPLAPLVAALAAARYRLDPEPSPVH